MIVSRVADDGEYRIYVTRFASVTTYFTDNGSGGVTLNVEPGFCSDPQSFERTHASVRDCVLGELARRLAVPVAEVLNQPFAALKDIADPPLAPRYHYARRSRGRTVPVRV